MVVISGRRRVRLRELRYDGRVAVIGMIGSNDTTLSGDGFAHAQGNIVGL